MLTGDLKVMVVSRCLCEWGRKYSSQRYKRQKRIEIKKMLEDVSVHTIQQKVHFVKPALIALVI